MCTAGNKANLGREVKRSKNILFLSSSKKCNASKRDQMSSINQIPLTSQVWTVMHIPCTSCSLVSAEVLLRCERVPSLCLLESGQTVNIHVSCVMGKDNDLHATLPQSRSF